MAPIPSALAAEPEAETETESEPEATAAAEEKSAPEKSERSLLDMGAARVLAMARAARESKGCMHAAPGYRVVAGMGEGQEAAQHELGECLMLMQGARPEETALFRQEGLFWLTRASYAGNARAQRALAVYYGAKNSAHASTADALKWALVYEKNGEADLYGYKALPETFVPGLKSDASPGEAAAAEAFAAGFVALTLAKFDPPLPERPEKGEGGKREQLLERRKQRRR
jgi:hypothetical protein